MINENKPVDSMKDLKDKMIPLPYHEMCETRHHKTIRALLIAWAASVVVIVLAFVYLWLQYDYVSTTEYQGVYNVADSEGNVLSSDLSPEDIIAIVEAINNGESTQNQSEG